MWYNHHGALAPFQNEKGEDRGNWPDKGTKETLFFRSLPFLFERPGTANTDTVSSRAGKTGIKTANGRGAIAFRAFAVSFPGQRSFWRQSSVDTVAIAG